MLKKSKFTGCLLGSLIGDCLGAPFEMKYFKDDGIKKKEIVATIQKTLDRRDELFKYTDDTAMTKSVASSLLECNGFDKINMATKFKESYKKEPCRGYGGGVVSIFMKWDAREITDENVYVPSQQQFNNSGSYGNGAAMRVSPVALFSNSVDQCIEIGFKSAELTHSNQHGINGAILQALAVYKALNSDPKNFDAKEFVTFLRNEMAKLENVDIKEYKLEKIHDIQDYTQSSHFSYCRQLDLIKKLVSCKDKNLKTVIRNIGNDVSAMTAVPAAIISFLQNVENGFEEVLYYSVSLGGDTDTIASMACAIAGAFYGEEAIPNLWKKKCEENEVLSGLGEKLHDSRTDRRK